MKTNRNMSKLVECRNFNTIGCKFGDSCHFLHRNKKVSPPAGLSSKGPARPLPVQTSSSSATSRTYTSTTTTTTSNTMGSSWVGGKSASSTESNKSSNSVPLSAQDVESLWNFEQPFHDDGVYYYGAPGTFDTIGTSQDMYTTAKVQGKSFSQALAENLSEEDLQRVNDKRPAFTEAYHPPTTKREVCTFFLAGTCKFGDYCRNLHSFEDTQQQSLEDFNDEKAMENMSTQLASVALNEDNNDDGKKECGICIEPASTVLYGILSHCDCKFCIDCIREWRKEGLTVAKKADQVRLCPLCRTESYFVIPSHKHVLGREKELLVEAYKTSLSRKPCKHYLAGECPFGTSCFYMHEEDGKKVTHVRVLYKSDEAACAPRKITLSDYL